MTATSTKKGFIHIYTGDGKGKTTAAIGLAIRASGYGLKTYMGQFMKGRHYGELTALKNNINIVIDQYGDTDCIHRAEVTHRHKILAKRGLETAEAAMLSGNYDIVILDEINVALGFNLFALENVLALLDKRPEHMEIILTGRNAPEDLIAIADLVSDIKEIKHYYHHGILAREGIEK